MNKFLAAWVLGVFTCGAAVAQESGWMLRARAVQVKMQDNTGASFNWTAENKSLVALDASYFLNKNVAVELLWPSSQTHAVTSAGANQGAFSVSPHALVLQYHVTDWARVQPYVGAGINNTQYGSANFSSNQKVDRSSWGAALQVGVNFPIDKNWLINIDMKKIYSQTDVESSAGSQLGTLKLNPTLTGVGVGYRF